MDDLSTPQGGIEIKVQGTDLRILVLSNILSIWDLLKTIFL